MKAHGFTVPEVLAGVAAVAALTAVAAPNLLEAETRTLVSRAEADLRSLATAVEAYRVDWGAPPNDIGNGWPWYLADALSTPVAYISAVVLSDPFRVEPVSQAPPCPNTHRYRYVNYLAGLNLWPHWGYPHGGSWGVQIRQLYTPAQWSAALDLFGMWKLSSAGPDRVASTPFIEGALLYDPTNGTISTGDIVRTQVGWGAATSGTEDI